MSSMSNLNFWVSWYGTEDMGEFELHSPWWKTGYAPRTGVATFCAAIRALNAEQARLKIAKAYDVEIKNPLTDIEWRFVNQRPDDWTPFNDRFPRADWMQWP